MQPLSDHSNGPGVQVQRYLTILHRRRGLIATCVLLTLLVATLYNYTARPIYQATAQILISMRGPDILPTQQQDLMLEMSDLETQFQLLRSRSLAERVVQQLNLQRNTEFQSGPLMSPWERIRRKFLGAKPPAIVDDDGLPLPPTVAAFRSRVRIQVVRGSRLVNVGFTAYNPGLTRDVANALAQAFIERSLENRIAASTDATGWLSEQLREQQNRVKAAERALQEYQVRNGLGNFEERLEMAEQELATLSAAATQAQMDRVEHTARIDQLKKTPVDQVEQFPWIQAHPTVRQNKATLSSLREEQRRLASTLGPRHPQMIQIDAQVRAAESQLAASIRDVSGTLQAELVGAVTREDELRTQSAKAEEDLQDLSQGAVEFRVLKRELDTAQELFQSLLTRTQETGLESELQATNVRLIEKAELPRAPFSPQRSRNYQLALLFGVVLGVGLSLGLDHLDNTIKTPDDIKEALRTPLLGMVPQVEARQGGTLQRLASETPQSAVAEAYRLLRTNLIFSTPPESGKVIIVSSPSPGEGKTTTVANLAASLAQNGAKVLAVDADLRRPTLHQHFSIRKAPGLSDLIVGKSAPSEAVQVTRFKGLHVLPCGYVPPNPAELLGSRNMRDVLSAFRDHYEWVLVDSAPILAMADTPVACPHTDGLVLVVASESTTAPAAVRALDQIAGVGGKVFGVVLNRVDLKRNTYYYSQYYGEYYRSYYAENPGGQASRAAGKIRRIDRSSA